MKTQLKLPRYRVEKAYNVSSDEAFRFVQLEKKAHSFNEKREDRIEALGGKVSPVWIFMSIIGLLAAIGFGIYGAVNAQGAISGIVDPNGDGLINPNIILLMGASISIIGMILGHLMFEGLHEGFTVDQYTGEKSPNPKLWYFVLGLVGASIYVWYQYSLVKSAGESADLATDSAASALPLVILGIALLELLIGAFILHKAFAYLLFFITTIVLASTFRQLNATARNTNTSFRQYLGLVDIYNQENPVTPIQSEGNSNIRKAITYYSGINLTKEELAEPEKRVLDNSGNEKALYDNPNKDNTNEPVSKQQNQVKDINDFLEDDIEDNLTV